MTETEKLLRQYEDREYAAFSSKLSPEQNRERIGVRVPDIRKIAGMMSPEEKERFLNALPHRYHEENQLHGFIIQKIKDFGECVARTEEFLPYVDDWSVGDCMIPKCFAKHKPEVLELAKKWMKSDHVYTVRFGVDVLMSLFLDGDFKEEYLELPLAIKSGEYYINMMIAWYYATALAKQWDPAVRIIEEGKLDTWVHNKSIQKAVESFRVSDEHKSYLKSLKKK